MSAPAVRLSAAEIATTGPTANRLIAALPDGICQQWLPHLETVDMHLGDVLYESGRTLRYVYFPVTSIVALLSILENGSPSKVAVVGNEGIVGVSTFMGGNSSATQAVVQSPGVGLRIPTTILVQAFEDVDAVKSLLLRYTQALLTQIAQTAVCNRHHNLDQRLCRLLLLSLDRLNTQELRMTQEFIASLLGVRREGVTQAALALQKAGVIRYQRGQISVIDRDGLERRSCECYGVVSAEYKRLLDTPSAQPLHPRMS